MRACHSMAIADFFRLQRLEIDFVVTASVSTAYTYAYTSKGRRARHALARAPTTGVRVDNGCRYHLVFTAGRKGDAWSVHLRFARGGQLLGSCFSFCRLAAASPPPLPFLLPRPRNGPLGRTYVPLRPAAPPIPLLNTSRPLRFDFLPSQEVKRNIKCKNKIQRMRISGLSGRIIVL